MHLATTARFIAAGELSDEVAIHNGIRQGCPLAPVLFVLAIDLLYQAADCDPELLGVQLSATARVVLAGYADDTKAYLSHPEEEPALLRLFDDFSAASGLRVNHGKCVAVCCSKTGPTQAHTAMSLPVLPGDRHHRLLGVQIASAPVLAHIWALTLQQLRATLHHAVFKTTDVLQRARISAAIVLPKLLFVGRHVWPTADTIDTLQRFVHDYVWGGSVAAASTSRRAGLRPDVAALKLRDGGLGVPDVRAAFLKLSERVTERWTVADSPIAAAVGGTLRRLAPLSAPHRATGIARLPHAPPRLDATLAATGLATIRNRLTLPRHDDEVTHTTELLRAASRGASKSKRWVDGWLVCDYSQRQTQLCELRRIQWSRYGDLSVASLRAAPAIGAGILLTAAGCEIQRKAYSEIVLPGARIGDIVDIIQCGDHRIKFSCCTVAYPLHPRAAIQFGRFCDALICNYPALLLPHNPDDYIQPRPPTAARWRVEHSQDGLHLWLDEGVGTETDLGVVTSKRTATRAAKAAGHAVATFDSHPLLDPFAQLWNLATPRAHHTVDATTLSPAAQHARDREIMATTADAAIGNALSRLSWNRISMLKTSASSQRLLVFKVKGLRLSGWARALGRRGCPYCEAANVDGGHTLHIVWSCPAAHVIWLILLRFWQRLGLWRHATVETGSFLSAVFSVHLPSTPAGAVPFGSIPGAPVDPDALHDLMQNVWERQVLAGFQTIWAWRQGTADSELPWTYPVACSAFHARLLDALSAAASSIPPQQPGAPMYRRLLLHGRHLVGTPPQMPSSQPTPTDGYVLFFDGGSRGNPGPGGAGAVVIRVDRRRDAPQLVWSAAMSLAAATTANNQAEYFGLVTGLTAAARHNWRPLEVVGDSLLIVRKMELYHPPTNSKLLSMYRQARHLADQLSVARWSHHLRAYNKMADAAANVAMNKRHSLQSLHPSPRSDWAGLEDLLLNDFLHWRSTSERR